MMTVYNINQESLPGLRALRTIHDVFLKQVQPPIIREKQIRRKKVRLPRFDYLKPETVEQALSLLASHREDAKILAGGTDLLVRMKKGLLKPKVLITLGALEELSFH